MKGLFSRKPIAALVAETEVSGLKRSMGAGDLIMLAIGAVIGAGCVVRGEVPPYAICMGNPAVVRRMRFEPAVIERLLRLRWWDWPKEEVEASIGWIMNEGGPALDKLAQSHLLGLMQPEDIARTALYLACDDSSMVTGQIVSVDSGVTIS